MFLYHLFYGRQLLARHAIILGQLRARLNPEFRLAVRTIYMNVRPFLLTGEEKEAVECRESELGFSEHELPGPKFTSAHPWG